MGIVEPNMCVKAKNNKTRERLVLGYFGRMNEPKLCVYLCHVADMMETFLYSHSQEALGLSNFCPISSVMVEQHSIQHDSESQQFLSVRPVTDQRVVHMLVEPSVLRGSRTVLEKLCGNVSRSRDLPVSDVTPFVVCDHPSTEKEGQGTSYSSKYCRRDQRRHVLGSIFIQENVRTCQRQHGPILFPNGALTDDTHEVGHWYANTREHYSFIFIGNVVVIPNI